VAEKPMWLYAFHAKNNVVLNYPSATQFEAIMVGCNKACNAVNLLQLASGHATNGYIWKMWQAKFFKIDDPQEQIDNGKTRC
jgi:hypothetical protein